MECSWESFYLHSIKIVGGIQPNTVWPDFENCYEAGKLLQSLFEPGQLGVQCLHIKNQEILVCIAKPIYPIESPDARALTT